MVALFAAPATGQMYEEDFSGTQSDWSCSSTGRAMDTCTADTTGSYSTPGESATAGNRYEICGEGGISKTFDFNRQPQYLEFDYRIQLDSWGTGTIFIEDSNGVRELIDRVRSGNSYDSGWRSYEANVESADKDFTLTAGSISSSSFCGSKPEDRSWQVWIDDVKVTSSADKPNTPSFRTPEDGATVTRTTTNLSVRITDPNDDSMTVEFKQADGSLIESKDIASGDTVTAYWQGLNDGETYNWFIEACDGTGQCRTTDTWSFTVDKAAEKTYTGVGVRDEDYMPTGDSASGTNYYYQGYVNKLEESSNQLEPGMDTSAYNPADYGIWTDSDGSQGSADQWAITRHLNWSISNRGEAYPPGPTGQDAQIRQGGLYHSTYSSDGGTYYHRDYSGSFRTVPSDPGAFTSDSVSKTSKVFGNSFAAIAADNFTGAFGEVREGDGVWIDPDDIRSMNDLIVGGWQPKLVYNIDITGPDMGLGFNLDDNAGITYRSGYGSPRSYVMYGNVYFEGEADGEDNDGDNVVDEEINSNGTVGETTPLLEPPMCGDDRREYLLEEMGESKRSIAGDGKYACADSQDVCVDTSAEGRKIFEREEYRQTDEPDEDFGRAKNDKEVCAMVDDDEVARWYDQDFKERLCRENTVYGPEGIRWFSEGQIAEHPAAFKGGIDDDFNQFIEEQRALKGETSRNIDSRPEQTFTSSNSLGSTSPVPTGSTDQRNGVTNDTIATPGFCGGDDDSEYLVTQDCVTSLCDTNNSVVGVASNSEACILDGEHYSEVGTSKRKLYQPGAQIDFDLGGDTRVISCYGGSWYEEWPVVFRKDKVQVPRGSSRLAQFQLINVENTELTFNVELRDSTSTPWNDPWSFFSQDESTKSDTFQVTLGPESSRTYTMSLYGGNQNVDNTQLTVYAESEDGTITGSDSIRVNVTEPINQTISSTQGSGEAVPGIGLTQIVVLMLLSSTAYLFMARP
ncbi:hypothetical protein [Candidatus Nanohalovita haloferacivicina]|uniref:hypothetical protein n=1 Tax=Candidatus Nanohalovita haloferacivicina TaxID=2978046 RepID=UPI00325FBB59